MGVALVTKLFPYPPWQRMPAGGRYPLPVRIALSEGELDMLYDAGVLVDNSEVFILRRSGHRIQLWNALNDLSGKR